jgi:hypothetical protein
LPYKLSDRRNRAEKSRHIFLFLLFILLAAALGYGLSFILGPGIDWTQTYRPAALSLLAGQSPYAVEIYFAAPWAVIPLLPFALLPEAVGRGMLFVLGLGVFAWTGYKLGAPPYALGAFLLSPQVIHCLLNSNIEWLALAGLLMPPWLGLIFLLIKPQIGLASAVYLAVLAFQRGGVKETLKTLAPAAVLTLGSILLYGFWPANVSTVLSLTKDYNQSFSPTPSPWAWPYFTSRSAARTSGFPRQLPLCSPLMYCCMPGSDCCFPS